MKTHIRLLVAGLICLSAFQLSTAQDRIPVELKPARVTIGLIEPSVIGEFKVGQRQSLVATGGFTLGVASNETVYAFPFLRGSFRHYYDRKRVKKNNLRTNSGNFVTLNAGYYFGALADVTTSLDQYFFIGPAWGIQRNYNSGIHLSLSLGGGYGNGPNASSGFAPTGHFTFGFTFN